jgi:hypothetical protein
MALALGKLNFSCAVIGLTFINRACRQRTGTPKFRGSGCQFPQLSKLSNFVYICINLVPRVFICITRSENNHFRSKNGYFPARNANIYKICELHRAIFSSFYNISQPNFAILLILRNSFQLW